MLLLLSLLSLGIFTYSTTDSDTACTYKTISSSFDLSPLTLSPTSSYSVNDIIDTSLSNYTFLFNICNNINNIPSTCKNNALSVPAYQVSKTECYTLASSYPNNITFNLLDVTDPSQGIKLIYNNGDSSLCPNGVHRSLTISLYCADTLQSPNVQRIYEYSSMPCQYFLTMNSIYGCPLECPIANRHLCNAHGLCRYDDTLDKSRCFCDNGYEGNDCTKLSSTQQVSNTSTCGTSCAVMAVAFVALFLLAGGAIAVLYHVRKLEDSQDKFDNLKTQFAMVDEEEQNNNENFPSDQVHIVNHSEQAFE